MMTICYLYLKLAIIIFINVNVEYPLKWCSVYLGDIISRGKRLEASVYDIEAKQARQLIQSGKFPITTIGGENGLTTSVSETLNNKIFRHDLLRIDCKETVDQGYIYAYLKSKIGNKILLTNSYGAVITHIEPEHLATVPIPNASQDIKKKIHDLIVHSFELRDDSYKLIDEAMKLLIHELKEQSVTNKNGVENFSVRLSELAGRVDASYHVPIVKTIIDHLNNMQEK